MAVFRVERTRDYTVMCNHHLKDSNLSLKAKGLLSMMLSLPDEWNYTTRGLATICKEGVDAIGKTLKEARVIAQHGRDLGLLQHDLGQPDPVGIARALPGQATAAMAALPLDQAREEKKGGSGQRGVGSGERHEEGEAVRKSGNPGRRRLNAAPGAGSGW